MTTPICCPSRASILTGRYLHNTGTMINTILHTILLKGVRNNTVSGGCSSSEWRDGLEAETFAVKLQKAACISICSHHRHHDNNPWSCHYFILILIIRQATPQCMPENTSIRFLSMIMMTMVALVKNTGWSEKTELESTKNGLTQWLFLIRYTWRGQGQVEKENCLNRPVFPYVLWCAQGVPLGTMFAQTWDGEIQLARYLDMLTKKIGFCNFSLSCILQYGRKAGGGLGHVPKGWHFWSGLVGNSRSGCNQYNDDDDKFFSQLMASLSSKEKWYNALDHCRYYNYTLSVNGKPEYHKDSYPRDYLTDVIRSWK